MSAPTRLPALRRARAHAEALRSRPDLVPLYLLAAPPSMLACAASTGAIGRWALLAAALVLVTLTVAAVWSLNGDQR